MVKKLGDRYKCMVCGNEVRLIKLGGGQLVCCAGAMDRMPADVNQPPSNAAGDSRRH